MSAPYTVDLTIDAVINALGAFLQPFIGTTAIVRAQQNRVAMPPDSFVKLTEILKVSLGTPITSPINSDTAQASILGQQRIDIQVDFYGSQAGNQASAVSSVYRTEYSCAQFPDGIAPLYCSDARQTPLVTGEEQYEERWTITASLQFNPSLYIPVQFATALGPVNTTRVA